MPGREDIPKRTLNKGERKEKRQQRVRGRRPRFGGEQIDLDALVQRALDKGKLLEVEKRPLLPEFIDKPVIVFDPEIDEASARIAPGTISRSVDGKTTSFDTYDMDAVVLPDISSTNSFVHMFRDRDAEGGESKQSFLEKQKKLSEAMEMMLFDLAQEIFGPDAEILMPALHGDIKEGTDLMVLYRDAEGNVADMMAVDITFAGSWEVHEKKASRSLRGIVRGRKGHVVSYVRIPAKKHDATDGYLYTTARNIPRIVLPMGRMTVYAMLHRWVNGEDFNFKGDSLRKGLLEAIQKQLEAHIDAYKQVKGEEVAVPRGLERCLERINTLRQSLSDTATRQDLPMRRTQAFSVGNTRVRTLKAAQEQTQRIDRDRRAPAGVNTTPIVRGAAQENQKPRDPRDPPPLPQFASFAEVSRALETQELPPAVFEKELLRLESQGKIHVTKTVQVPAAWITGEEMKATELWEITNMEDRTQRVLYYPTSYKNHVHHKEEDTARADILSQLEALVVMLEEEKRKKDLLAVLGDLVTALEHQGQRASVQPHSLGVSVMQDLEQLVALLEAKQVGHS